MPARRVPLIWKTQKESEQTYFKYNPASQRLVRYGCDCPPPPPPPPQTFQFLAFGASSGSPTYYISGSYDGITWEQTSITGDVFANQANDGAYDSVNNRWVAIGSASAPCASISDDNGLTWSSTGLAGFFLTSGRGIAHDGIGRWVATGLFNPERLLTSTDGLAWATTTGNGFGVGGSVGGGVAYNSGTWIAVGKTQASGFPILRSANGTNWTGVSNASFEGYKVAYGNGVWMTVGQGTNTIYRSTDDGLTWNPVIGYGFSTRGQGIAYDGVGRWVAVGVDGSYNIITSTDDGLTWTDVGLGGQYFDGNGGQDVLFKNNLWLACGNVHLGLTAILKSTDGLTWTSCSGDTFGSGSVFGLAST